MRQWFQRLPIHQKLVTLALLVTALALGIAMLCLAVFDVWRYRASASDEAGALAAVLAENTAAAVAFKEPGAAAEILRSIRVRTVVVKACVYLPDGTLFAEFSRRETACSAALQTGEAWSRLSGTAAITRNERHHGTVYVERDLSDLSSRLGVTGIVGVSVFLAAALAAFVLAQRLHAAIAAPIAALAVFTKRFGSGTETAILEVNAPPDEVGDLVTSVRDMAQRVRAANRLKDELLAAVSHELRTPLNAMMGWAQLLGSTAASPEMVRQAAANIVKNAKVQTRVIEDLIDVSRIATGKMRLAVEAVDMRAVVTTAAETMRPVAEATKVRLVRQIPETPCYVMGDRDRLQQVLWNLMSNAVKFTPGGGVVAVDLVCERERLLVTVTDTGAGIEPAFLPYVFERFRQADASTTRSHGGLGLGLAIVKELTELHGGSVSAQSDGPDRGAIFTVALPRAIIEDHVRPEEDAATPAAALSLAGATILAVDDNEDALAIMAAALMQAGATVETATSPQAALALWAERPRDILVCDLAMPLIDGVELLRRIREADAPLGRITPAVAVSAHASEGDRASSLRAGFHAHVTKPFTHDALIRAVAGAMPAGSRRHDIEAATDA
jgi:signal transduction histidine kinase/ActR/RegA family two-component response regulator